MIISLIWDHFCGMVCISYREVLYFELLDVRLDPADLHPHLPARVPHRDLVALERRPAVRLGRAPLDGERVRAQRRDLERRRRSGRRACCCIV